MSNLIIRDLKPEDKAAWLPLWQGYQSFYKADLSGVTDITFARFFDGLEPMHALVAEKHGVLLGFTHYLFHRSTWLAGPTCYLQDLFTSEAARGQGVARALIEAVYGRAQAAGASRAYWMTHEDNTTARALYDRIANNAGFIQYRKLF